MSTATPEAAERLEYLRGEIDAERISYSEIAELQDLAEHIDPGDVQLREWAGLPEDLRTLADAAVSWADELEEYIAPASERFEDEESAEGQKSQAQEIREASGRAYALLHKLKGSGNA